MSDPLFIARFENGHETCTAVFCMPEQLDWEGGIKVAKRAYRNLLGNALRSIHDKQSRGEAIKEEIEFAKELEISLTGEPPRIIYARFELGDGQLLEARFL
jgi:hypothetical protein